MAQPAGNTLGGLGSSELITDRRGLVLFVSCATTFLLGVAATAINPVLETLTNKLGLSGAQLNLSVSIYPMMVAALVITGGNLGDLFGQRRILVVGLAVFGLSACIVATAGAPWVLIIGRAIRGAGTAILLPASTAVLRVAYPPAQQGFPLGIWGAVGSLSFTTSPLFSGWLAGITGWSSMWWISAFLSAVIAALAWWGLRDLPTPTPLPSGKRLNTAGVVLLAISLSALLLALTQGPRWGWASRWSIIAFGCSALAMFLLTLAERRVAQPLLDLKLMRLPSTIAAAVVTMLNIATTLGILYFVNLFSHANVMMGFSTLTASVALLPFAACSFTVSTLAGRYYDRHGYQKPVAIGLLMMSVGTVLLGVAGTLNSYAAMVVPLLLAGIGVGLTAGAPFAIGLQGVRSGQAGALSGILSAFRYLGAAFAIAIGTLIYTGVAEIDLNAHMLALGVPHATLRQLDALLSAPAARSADVRRRLGLTSADDAAFREGELHGLDHGFATAFAVLGGTCLLAAAAWPKLVRRTTELQTNRRLPDE